MNSTNGSLIRELPCGRDQKSLVCVDNAVRGRELSIASIRLDEVEMPTNVNTRISITR